MSDAIGGSGGGGGGFDLGAMIGGIFGGGGGGAEQADGKGGGSDPMQSLQKMLDPLGIFPGLAGGIGKMLKGADASQITEEGKLINNEIAAFDENQIVRAPPPDAAEPPVYYSPLNDETQAGKGYAAENKPLDQRSQAVVADAQKRQLELGTQNQNGAASSAAGTAQAPIEQRASASSASAGQQQSASSSPAVTVAQNALNQALGSSATGGAEPTAQELAIEERKAERRALSTIYGDPDQFDHNTLKDGLFDKADLEKTAREGSTPELREAAQYLLDHPDLMLDLQVSTGRGRGLMCLDAVAARIQALVAQPQPPGGTSGTGGIDGKDGKDATDVVHDADGPDRTQSNPPLVDSDAKTLEDCLEDIGGSLAKKEAQLIALLKSDDANPGKIAAAQQELARINQTFQQMYELIGNLRRTFHEMSMSSIGHIR